MTLRLRWHIKICKIMPCEQCIIAKATQKNMNKGCSARRAAHPNKRWSYDIATIKPPKKSRLRVTRLNWHIMVEKYSGVKVSAFFQGKNNIIKTMCNHIQKAKHSRAPVKYLRLDNARENFKIQSHCNSTDWKLTVFSEYTAKEMPHKSSMSETVFTPLAARGHVMLAAANVLMAEDFSLFQEAANHTTKIDWFGNRKKWQR